MNDSRRKCNGGEISWRRDCLTDMAVRFHCKKKDGGATAAAIKAKRDVATCHSSVKKLEEMEDKKMEWISTPNNLAYRVLFW
ncbi:hypothetical protein L195_g048140, partial [Trifolium pratense]